MQARILFVSDLHKRDSDFTTVTGYVKAIDTVQDDLLRFIHDNNITHLISLGDWYDRGYRNVNRLFSDYNYDRLLADAVNGNFYICRGNHLFIERDANPEMYLIQPCPAMSTLSNTKLYDKPIIQSIDKLKIGTVQISFFHFNKENKDYVADRDEDTTFHIGVYHDDTVLPSSVRYEGGDRGTTTKTSIEHLYKNIDLGIIGHIHTPIGLIQQELYGRKVNLIIPGSMCITRNKTAELHHTTELPIVNIEDDNKVKLQLAKFSTHMELLQLYNKDEEHRLEDMLPGSISDVTEVKTQIKQALNLSGDESLKELLAKQGYSSKHLEVLDKASSFDLKVLDVLHLLGGEI